jgi:hypothetical protein
MKPIDKIKEIIKQISIEATEQYREAWEKPPNSDKKAREIRHMLLAKGLDSYIKDGLYVKDLMKSIEEFSGKSLTRSTGLLPPVMAIVVKTGYGIAICTKHDPIMKYSMRNPKFSLKVSNTCGFSNVDPRTVTPASKTEVESFFENTDIPIGVLVGYLANIKE